jgi:hypothetical protein
MREHSDEYFTGQGKKQNAFFKGSSDGICCDMSSTIIRDQGYMLGNLISIEQIKDECLILLNNLKE